MRLASFFAVPESRIMQAANASVANRPRSRTRRWYVWSMLLLASTGWAETPQVKIEARPAELTRNLEASLDVGGESCTLEAGRQSLLERNLLTVARNAAQAVGYYDADIQLGINRDDDCWTLRVKVKAGEPVRIEKVDVVLEGPGQDDDALQQVIREQVPEAGQILRHDVYQQLRNQLVETAARRGYFDHALTRHRLEVDTLERTARIILHLDTGPRYHFGEVELIQDILRDERVRPYLTFKPGDPWDTNKLLDSQQALLGSGYFATARIERQDPEPGTLRVPLSLHLTPRNEWAWLAGIGISTDTGPRLRLGAENRYVNRRGHRWRAQAEGSEVRSSASTSYEMPLADPVHDKLIFSGGYENEETESRDSEQIGIGASLITELPSRWVLTRALEYEREIFQIADEHGETELLMPGVQLQRIRANDPIYPRRGWKLGIGLRGTSPAISSTDSFIQSQLWTGAILPFFKGRFLSRARLAHTDVDDVSTLPGSVRFFAGGDNSIRGYDYQTLGPRNAEGEVIGGRHLLVGSLELEYPLFGRWHAAVFTDAGNAFNEYDELDIRQSAGLGVRWRSPLGPIRIDFAHPMDSDRNWRLHLSMGPDL